MTDFPFQLTIKNASSGNREETLTCTALLRQVKGKRKVYDALWAGQNVIAKVFSDRFSAKRHLKKEWRGLKHLEKLRSASPKALFYGETEDGRQVVITEKIVNSKVAFDSFNETCSLAEKTDLLISVCKLLAKQHANGIIQKDLHLGNFLLANDKVYALDPACMEFCSYPIKKNKSIMQLAILACSLSERDQEAIAKICDQYAQCRQWNFDNADKALFDKFFRIHKKQVLKRSLKKTLRTSKRYLKIEKDGFLGVFDRSFCEGKDPLDFIKQIDSLMDKGDVLKDGNTCYVSRLRWNGQDIVIKRYNHKGLIHSLRHTIKKSRGRRVWLHSHRLGMLGIAAHKPAAFVEYRKASLVWKSYIITEYVEGRRLSDFIQHNTDGPQQSNLTKKLSELLEKLHACRITHGDLKPSNILITPAGPVLTDLDAMMVHKWNWLFKIKKDKDLNRFHQN